VTNQPKRTPLTKNNNNNQQLPMDPSVTETKVPLNTPNTPSSTKSMDVDPSSCSPPRTPPARRQEMPRNELVLEKHVGSLLDGVQNVAGGFYGEQTRARVMETSLRLANVADASCANIEKKLTESTSMAMLLKVKHDEADENVAKTVQAGKLLQSFMNDLRQVDF